jgi:Carbamoyltransferase C-terminus
MKRERSRKQGRRPPAAGHRSGSPAVLVNTSFNVWGEPIVCTPDDAYRCFMNTEMDNLVIGNFIIERLAQPHAKVERRLAPLGSSPTRNAARAAIILATCQAGGLA